MENEEHNNFMDAIINALNSHHAEYVVVSVSKRGEVTIGLANSKDIRRDGIFAPSAGCLIISPNTRFTADEIAEAVKAYISALPEKSSGDKSQGD